MKIILTESRYDFKYRNIFERIPGIKIVEGTFIELLKILVRRKCYYHIRYIKYRGPIIAILRIILVFSLSKISGSKIIWSCHNIYEHKIPSQKVNDVLRTIICFISYKIVVFHEDLVSYLPRFTHKKIIVASFGDFKEFIEKKTKENKEFEQLYEKWLKKRNIQYPDIVSISAAKRNNMSPLTEGLNGTSQNVLIIAPNQEFANKENFESNIFVYNKDFVEKEISVILNSPGKLIGYIGHENISVPTSIYMYASFGIPVIGLNVEPVSSIIKEYSIGEIIDEKTSLDFVVKKNNCQL